VSDPGAGAWEGGEHVLPVRVYYADTDFTGVVYHGAFVNFLERGRSDALRLLGVHHAALSALDPPMAFAVTRLEIDYRKPARIDDALLIRTRMISMKGARLVLSQNVDRGGERLCDARLEIACVGLDGRARRPTPAMTAAIEPLIF
jgi:acyl-CoA thioester hydrolase